MVSRWGLRLTFVQQKAKFRDYTVSIAYFSRARNYFYMVFVFFIISIFAIRFVDCLMI